jgi:hypothetical protein
MWHHKSVVALLQIALRLLADLITMMAFAFRQRRATAAEILVLRRQLALYKERGTKPRRIDRVTRISLAFLSRFFNWRDALVIVRPETMIRWHRGGWRLFWRVKSRPGRPPIALEIQILIRRMANENPSWGEERIANELRPKLGIGVSARTVNKYLPKRPTHRPRSDLRWSTFLRLHAKGIVACDFLVAVTATFRLLYVFVVIACFCRVYSAFGPAMRTDGTIWSASGLALRCGFCYLRAPPPNSWYRRCSGGANGNGGTACHGAKAKPRRWTGNAIDNRYAGDRLAERFASITFIRCATAAGACRVRDGPSEFGDCTSHRKVSPYGRLGLLCGIDPGDSLVCVAWPVSRRRRADHDRGRGDRHPRHQRMALPAHRRGGSLYGRPARQFRHLSSTLARALQQIGLWRTIRRQFVVFASPLASAID